MISGSEIDKSTQKIDKSTQKKRGSYFERKPDWVKMMPVGKNNYNEVRSKLRIGSLHTVCEEARCPNIGECWSHGTATVMILGDVCTRGCRFCNVKTGNPGGLVDTDEPKRVGKMLGESELSYVVITCVDRDDLDDGGAEIFAETIKEVKSINKKIKIEALTSDYRGSKQAVETILASGLDVMAHNVETVRALTPMVRDKRANYDQSLKVLETSKQINSDILTKSSLMVGLGETFEELKKTASDLRDVGVDIITFGQYLRPSIRHLSVKRYWFPDEFKQLELMAKEMGFLYVASGPLVRSSYRAGELFTLGFLEKKELEKKI